MKVCGLLPVGTSNQTHLMVTAKKNPVSTPKQAPHPHPHCHRVFSFPLPPSSGLSGAQNALGFRREASGFAVVSMCLNVCLVSVFWGG